MLQKLLYTGIGAGLLLKDKVEDELQKLQDDGKIKTDDAKSFLDSLKVKGEQEDEKVKEKLKSTIKEIVDELGIATKEDLEKLKNELKG